MRLAALVLMVGYAIIGLVFFVTSLYLYLSGTDNKTVWRFNNFVIRLVVILGLTLVAGSILMTVMGITIS